MNGFGGDSILVEDLVQLDGVLNVAHKNDDLVELKVIDQVHQFGDFGLLIKAHVVLGQTVQCELALLLNQDFCGVTHELAACQLDFVRKSGREHHDLLAVGSLLEDLLDVTAHIYGVHR